MVPMLDHHGALFLPPCFVEPSLSGHVLYMALPFQIYFSLLPAAAILIVFFAGYSSSPSPKKREKDAPSLFFPSCNFPRAMTR